MEAAGVVDHTWPLQNRLAFGPWWEVYVETPVIGGCRVAKDVGISPLDNVIHVQLCRGRPKHQFVDFDYVNLRLVAPRQGHAGEKAEHQRPTGRHK